MGLFRKSSGRTEHAYIEERLSPYLDDELPPQERRLVERHLAKCQRCRWDLLTLQQTVRCMKELPTVAVPRSFAIPVPAPTAHVARRAWGLPLLQGATALVALLFVFAVAGDLFLARTMPALAPQPQTTLKQAEEAVAPAPTVVAVEVTVEVEREMPTATQAPAPAAEVTGEPAAVETTVAEVAGAAAEEEPQAKAVAAPQVETQPQTGVEETTVVSEAAVAAATPPPPTAPDEVSLEIAAETPTAVPAPAEPTPTAAPVEVARASQPPAEPTTAAALPEAAADAEQRQEPVSGGTLRDSLQPWLAVAQYALGLAFILLALITIVITLRRLKRS